MNNDDVLVFRLGPMTSDWQLAVWHKGHRRCQRGNWVSDDGRVAYKRSRTWKIHIHHWSVSWRPLLLLKSWIRDRCDWCGNRFAFKTTERIGYLSSNRVWHERCFRDRWAAKHGAKS